MKNFLLENVKTAKSHRDWKAIMVAYTVYKQIDPDIETIRPELDRLRKENQK